MDADAPITSAAGPAAAAGLPLIDFAGWRGTDPVARREVAQALRAACERRGFFYLCNHGVAPELIDAVFAGCEAFFDQPMEAKLRLDKALSSCNRGYEPLRAQTLEAGAPPDLKEGFYIGHEVAADDPKAQAGRFNVGPNQWPEGLPEFRPAMQAYFAAAHALAADVIRALAASLDLPADHFEAYLADASATLRLLHYPPQPPDPSPGEKGCGAHTDFGAVTLLLQDDCGGLQAWDAGSEGWVDAPPVPGTYVVNVGDLVARWTNGRYRSTLHRVVNVSGRERHSIPFFFTGNPDHLVECIATCLAAGEQPKHPPITVQEHLRDCYRRTYR
jgi:isopenicillin N synthase-like dioxygenase